MADDRKSVLVTGAANGIGRATAERLSANGWSVLAVDRDADKLAWTDAAANVAAFPADISSSEANQAMVAEAERLHGPLHAAVLNAGIKGGGSIDELSFEDFQRIISVNLFGAVLGVKAVLPSLRKNKGGAICITSSTMGIGGESENWAYGTSKHAIVGLVRSLSRELGWEGIRINALCPGTTKSGMTDTIEDLAPEHYALLSGQVPLQRFAEAEEMASVIEFLVSPAASYVSGHAMVADGGTSSGTGLLGPGNGAKVIPAGINED